jgi:hypothetical protein
MERVVVLGVVVVAEIAVRYREDRRVGYMGLHGSDRIPLEMVPMSQCLGERALVVLNHVGNQNSWG